MEHGEESEIFGTQSPIYNLEPSPGHPAEFGFLVGDTVPVYLNSSVRTGEDYGITVTAPNISQAASVYATKVTIWGVPADPSHNSLRGQYGHNGGCLKSSTPNFFGELGLAGSEFEQEAPQDYESGCTGSEGAVSVPVLPLLTNPTSCGVPRTGSVTMASWQEPLVAPILPSSKSVTLPELSGCEKLDFSPSISVTPDGTDGSTPTGLNVDLHVPQESTQNPEGLGEADVKDTTVTLPAGVQISPSAADGLQACSQAQIGLDNAEKPSCPDASKIATVRIKTPLLEEELVGEVYLAAPQNFAGPLENLFGSLIAMYLVAEDPVAGVLIKLPGKVTLNETTGQILTTFEDTPQLPFSDLKLEFFGTDRAPLSTPALCGSYGTDAIFAPWSGTPPVSPAASFQITSGPAGAPCQDPLPFAPSLTTGTTNIQAGSFTPYTLTMGREDGEQNLDAIQLHMPPGLLGTLASVKLCEEAQADAGTCGEESLIGETIVSVGLGNDPYTVTGGKVYITGPYEGAPYGLSIVNPAKAGPFVLQEGKPVVVRAKIEVNPTTAALSITTDTSGPYKIPTILDGIPLEIKHINVSINRPDFTFNPTNCEKLAITGSLTSSEGAISSLSVPFQVTNCAALAFKANLEASTSGKTSRTEGASLHVKLSYPVGPYDANIAKVKVELPEQLPSRLTTLQKACTAAIFEANPANCPAASRIGSATATTPVLPVSLSGPAYFVSHGGAKFPELIIVLQGYGTTVDLHGETFISKSGVTSSTFPAVPDVPVGSFELTLPEGPDSALSANTNLCKSKLVIPTQFVGQNGAEVHESTKIAVTGCAKTITVKHKKKKAKGKKASITVSVPSAGRITASAAGLRGASAHIDKAGELTLTLALTSSEQRLLARHRGHELAAHVHLRFTPSHGKALTSSTMVLLG